MEESSISSPVKSKTETTRFVRLKGIGVSFISVSKTVLFLLRPHLVLLWLSRPLLMAYNTLRLTSWVASVKNCDTDFPALARNYSRRYRMYDKIISKLHEPVQFLEFGVYDGASIVYWADNYKNQQSTFYGFDTFEGLPESWGIFYSKGDMAGSVSGISDPRVLFIKGLFQQTLPRFLAGNKLDRRLVVHFDADLFSSTLYPLMLLIPYFKVGDILIFDEFNVPNHEFMAFNCFLESSRITTKPVFAVNNYLQVAFEITDVP